MYVFAMANAFQQWDNLSETGRAQSILISAKMVSDVAGRYAAIYKDYKDAKNPVARENAAQRMNENFDDAMRRNGNNLSIELNEVNSRGALRGADGVRSRVATVADGSIQHGAIGQQRTTWMQAWRDRFKVTDGMKQAWKKFNTPANWFRAIGLLISVALVV
jgi:hypothetical protein